MIKEDSPSCNGDSKNSTLYLILLKLCPLHQHLLVVVLKFLAEDYRSKLKSSNSTKEKNPCMSAVSDCKVLCRCKTKFPITKSCNESISECTGQQLAKVSRASSNASVLSNTSDCNSKDSDKRYSTRTRPEPQRRSFRCLAKSNAEDPKHQSERLQNGPAQVNCRRSCSTAPRARQLGRAKSPSPPTLSPVDSPDELEDCDIQQNSKIPFRKSRPPRLMPQDDQGFTRQSVGSLHPSSRETLEHSRNLTAVQKRGLKAVHNGEFEKGSSERSSEKDSLESTVLVDELMDRINLRLQTIETTVHLDGSNLVSKLSENSNKNNGKRMLDDITSLMQPTKDKRDYSLVDLLRKHEIHVVQTRLRRRQQNLGTLPQSVLSPTNEVGHRSRTMQIKNQLADLDCKFSLSPFNVTKELSTDAASGGDDGTNIDRSDKESKFDSIPAQSPDSKPAIRRPSIQINSCEFYSSPSQDSDIIYVDNFPDELSYSEIQFKNMWRSTARKSTRRAFGNKEYYELQTICLRGTADTSENEMEPHQPQENDIHLKEHMAAPANVMVDIAARKQENCNWENGEQPLCKDSRVSCISETKMFLKAEHDSSKRVPGPRKSSRLILKERADAKTNERVPLNSRRNVNGHEKLMDENTQAAEKIASCTKRSEGSAKHQSTENIAAVNTSTVLAEPTSSGNYQPPCQQNALSCDAFELSTCTALCSSGECVHSEFKGTLSHGQCVREGRNIAGRMLSQTGDGLIIKDGTDKAQLTTNAVTSQRSQRVPSRNGAASAALKGSVAKASNNISPIERSPVTSDRRTLRRSHHRHTQSVAVDECSKEQRKESPSQTDLSGKEKVNDLERTPCALEDAGRISIESSSTAQECQPHDACADSQTCFRFSLDPALETSLKVKCPDDARACLNGGEGDLKDDDAQILCSHDVNGDHNHSGAEMNSTCNKEVGGIVVVVVVEDVQRKRNMTPPEDLPLCTVSRDPDCSRECLQPCHSESESRERVQNSLKAVSNDSSSSLIEPKSPPTVESPAKTTGVPTPSTDGAKWSRSEFMKLIWQKRRSMLSSTMHFRKKNKCSNGLANTAEQTPESNNNSFISKLRPRLFYGRSTLNISTKTPISESHRTTTSVSSQTQSTSKEQIHELHFSELSNKHAIPEVSILDEDAQQNVNNDDGKMQTRSQMRTHETPEQQLQEKCLQHRVSEKHGNGTHSLSDNCTVLKNVFTQEIEMYNDATQPSAQPSIYHTFIPNRSPHLYDAANIGPVLNFAGEYFVHQEMVASINEQYENINQGWIPVKNCDLLAKGKTPSERKKDVWLTGKKRTKKAVNSRLSLIPQLFSSSWSLPKLQEWFLESTETKRLPILSKANARDPFSVLQASREKTTQMLNRKSVALTAKCDRMEKHLKKFALTASNAQEGPTKQNAKKVARKAKLISQSHSKRSVTGSSEKERSTNSPGKEKAQSLQNDKPKPSRDAPENKLTTVSQSNKSSYGYCPRVCQQKWLQGERISKKYMNMRGKATWTGAHCGKLVRLPRELKALWEDVHNNIPAVADPRIGKRKSRMQSVNIPTPMLSIGMKDAKLQNESKSPGTNSRSPLKGSEPPQNDVKTKCSSSGDPASLRVSKTGVVANRGHVDSRTVSLSLKSRPVLRGREATEIRPKSPLRLSKLGEADRKRGHDDMAHASAAKKIHFDLRECKKT